MMFSWSVLFVLLIDVTSVRTDQQDRMHPIRQTNYGKIKGYIHSRPNGKEVERYIGVPYAAPPVGKLRFKRPVKPSPWKGIFDATTKPYACFQSSGDIQYIMEHDPNFDGTMKEDCLHLNIYVPVRSIRQTTHEKTLPVLVHIHGGSDEAGMGAMLHGDTLASEGRFIVVTVNYRLGVLGFLSVPHLNIPGNYGLFDQSLAFLWVQENIAFFGGDPQRVTVQGHSAGSSNLGLHILSPVSKGFFQNAILMSGSPTAYWAIIPPSGPTEENAGPNRHLKTLGCYFKEDQWKTLSCLENINISQILAENGYFHHDLGFYDFTPVVDGTFVVKDPKKGFDQVNVNSVMIGLVKDEGSLTADIILKQEKNLLDSGRYMTLTQILNSSRTFTQAVDTFDHSIFRKFSMPPVVPYKYVSSLKDWTYYIYKPWEDPENATAGMIALSDFMSDVEFTAASVQMADMLTPMKDLKVFLYLFEHRSTQSIYPKWMGVPHGQDIFYLFGCPLDGHPLYKYTDLDKKVSLGLIDMWSRFIRTGLPIGTLNDTYTYKINKTYIRISSNNTDIVLTKGNNLRPAFVAFWNELLPALLKNLDMNFKDRPHSPNQDFRIWLLIAFLILLFGLFVVLMGCLVHRYKKKQSGTIVPESGDSDTHKIPML